MSFEKISTVSCDSKLTESSPFPLFSGPPRLVIDFVAVQSSNGFNPKVVDCIAREFGLHRGSMLMATWSGGSVKEWPNLRVVIRGDEAPVVNPLAAVTSNKEQTEEITDEDEKR